MTIDELFKQRRFFITLINNIADSPISAATLSLLTKQLNERLAEIALEHSYLEACCCRSLFRELLNAKFKSLSQGTKSFYDVIFSNDVKHTYLN